MTRARLCGVIDSSGWPCSLPVRERTSTKTQVPRVVGDDVELALGAAPVARHDAEARPLEERGGEILGATAASPGREAKRSEDDGAIPTGSRGERYEAGVVTAAAGAAAAGAAVEARRRILERGLFSPLMRAALPCSSRR